jgi:hypothetical protein
MENKSRERKKKKKKKIKKNALYPSAHLNFDAKAPHRSPYRAPQAGHRTPFPRAILTALLPPHPCQGTGTAIEIPHAPFFLKSLTKVTLPCRPSCIYTRRIEMLPCLVPVAGKRAAWRTRDQGAPRRAGPSSRPSARMSAGTGRSGRGGLHKSRERRISLSRS